MNAEPTPSRLDELGQRFAELAAQIPDSPQREALSVLHGMVQEVRRAAVPRGSAAGHSDDGAMTLEHVANLYKTAPGMAGTAENEPLPVGTVAPDFTLSDASGRRVSLHDFRGRSVVLAFYPLDWSPTCSDQLSLYQAELEEFERLGATVVGISVDSIYSHGAWAAVRGLTMPLLADFEPKGEVARRYNAYRAGDGFSERALYVIDAEGVIRYAHVSPQLDHIPDIYELLDVLRDIAASQPNVAPSRATESREPVGVGGAA